MYIKNFMLIFLEKLFNTEDFPAKNDKLNRNNCYKDLMSEILKEELVILCNLI